MAKGSYVNRVKVLLLEQSMGHKPMEQLRKEAEAVIQKGYNDGWTYRGVANSWSGNQRAIVQLVFVRKEMRE